MSVINSALTIGAFTFISRILGFLREGLMSAIIGTGMFMDCFLVALRLANTCRKIFAEGAFNASFIPRFIGVLEKDNKDSANILLSKVFSLMLVSTSILAVIAVVFYPSIIGVMAPGFVHNHVKFELTNHLGRITFPFIIFISLTALFCGVANAVKKFAVPTIIYSTLNICSIITMIYGWYFDKSTEQIINMLAFSVLTSGAIQILIMWIYLTMHGFRIRFTVYMFSNEVNDILKNMVPGLVSAGVWQINLLIDVYICSHLPTGTISCLNLADKLNQCPLAILGTAIGTAMLPILSKAVAEHDQKSFNNELQGGLLFVSLLMFPALVVLFTLSDAAVATAFQRGVFGGEYVGITAQALRAFSLGLPAYILTKALSSVFFSYKDTIKPTIYAICSVISNIGFIIILVPFGKHYSVALSTSLSAYVNAMLLLIFAIKLYNVRFSLEFLKKILVQLLAFIITFCVMYFFGKNTWRTEYGNSLFKWVYSFTSIGIAILLYWVLIYAFLTLAKCKRCLVIWHPRIWAIR